MEEGVITVEEGNPALSPPLAEPENIWFKTQCPKVESFPSIFIFFFHLDFTFSMPKSPYFKAKSSAIKLTASDPLKKTLPDYIDYDLRVLFVGINPGITSAARGHHFAGPTNHFWPCLSDSGKYKRKWVSNSLLLTYMDSRLGR